MKKGRTMRKRTLLAVALVLTASWVGSMPVLGQTQPTQPDTPRPAGGTVEDAPTKGRLVEMRPDLTRVVEGKGWRVVNRSVTLVEKDGKPVIRLNEGTEAGIAWLKDFAFSKGTIEFDARGTNIIQKSFLGVAFHGVDEKTYDAVYFRPFNFRADDPVRRNHTVQYISHPTYTWQKLRQEQPEKCEKPVVPAPDPNGWFHVRVVVTWPKVSVFVNGAQEPSLRVDQLSDRKTGWIGLWVDVGGGEFANLRIQ